MPVILDGVCQVFRACLAILTNDISSLKFGKFFRSLGSVIMASPAILIGDEPAIKHCVGNKGSAGNKPCILCSNCVSVRSELWQHSGNLFPHSCYDFSKFQPSTDESVWEKVELLTARKPVLSKSGFLGSHLATEMVIEGRLAQWPWNGAMAVEKTNGRGNFCSCGNGGKQFCFPHLQA